MSDAREHWGSQTTSQGVSGVVAASVPPWIRIATLIWGGLASIGCISLLVYSITPGAMGDSLANWPSNSSIIPDPARANLVLLMHPHCPCSRATLTELEEILARCPGKVSTHILFFKPRSEADDWAITDLWRRAAAIPEVQVHVDEEGQEARRFAAATSGHALLFDRAGQQVFRSGITISRAHVGENPGSSSIISCLTESVTTENSREHCECNVFGCPLFADGGNVETGEL